jgi:hypothetical protein
VSYFTNFPWTSPNFGLFGTEGPLAQSAVKHLFSILKFFLQTKDRQPFYVIEGNIKLIQIYHKGNILYFFPWTSPSRVFEEARPDFGPFGTECGNLFFDHRTLCQRVQSRVVPLQKPVRDLSKGKTSLHMESFICKKKSSVNRTIVIPNKFF